MDYLKTESVVSQRTDVREIADALGLMLKPNQYVEVDGLTAEDRKLPLTGRVKIRVVTVED